MTCALRLSTAIVCFALGALPRVGGAEPQMNTLRLVAGDDTDEPISTLALVPPRNADPEPLPQSPPPPNLGADLAVPAPDTYVAPIPQQAAVPTPWPPCDV